MPYLTWAFHAAVVLLVAFAAYEDLRYLRLRNTISLAVVVLFIPYALTLTLNEIALHMVIALTIFVIGVALFFAGLFGGGDAKLLGAIALWPALHDIPFFLLATTTLGGALALIALGLRRGDILPKMALKMPRLYGPETGWFARLRHGESVVPYGIAFALGTLITLF